MNWDDYKDICDRPDVCSRWLLEQTLELVEDRELAARLRGSMAVVPIEKPEDHLQRPAGAARGGAATDMFPMALSLADVNAICHAVEAALGRGTTTRGTDRRGLGGFLEAWQEYQRYLASPRAEPRDCSPRS